MDRIVAKRIIDCAARCSRDLVAMVELAKASNTAADAPKYAVAVGHVAAELYPQIKQPLLDEHPDLRGEI